MAPKRRCPVCGSKQWHKEPSSGLITCSEGHVLQNYRNETREVTELGPHALRKRTLKSVRKKREKLSKADPNLYHGERARFHYFQCLQLILRMQISALIEAWGLPPEFEIICKDIWALHLSLLPKPPPAEPLRFRQDRETTEESEARARPQSTLAPDDASDGEQEAEELHGDAARASSSSSSASDEEDEDPAIAELMRENSETSSSEEDAPRPRAPTENAKKKRPDRQFDAPASTIAVLIVACWTLRLPVTHMDFIKLIEAYKLPYMDPTRLLPAGLTVHLTKHVVQALSPKHAPTPILLHGLASRLARLMHSEYGVYTPEMNSSPLLWRAVRATCGTPTLYVMSKKVARVLSVPVMLHRSLASPLARTKKRDPEFHKYDSIVPEVALISVVIVVLKMVYGLDGKERLPKDRQDPACALPLLTDFLQCIKEVDEKHEDRFEFSAMAQLSTLDLDDSAIDRYLDFCETALLPREDQRDERVTAMKFFPLRPQPPRPARAASLRDVHEAQRASLPPTPLNEDATGLLPGQAYAVYNTQDVLGALPEQYETVIARAAQWSGVNENYVASVVERFERRLIRWWDQLKRRERDGRRGKSAGSAERELSREV